MRYANLTRALAALMLAVLLLSSLLSCSGPDLTGLSGEELRTYTAMKTDNFEITGSMYAYFFMEIGAAYVSEFSEEALAARGYDDEKSLKAQKYDADMTWYDYINEYVQEEVSRLLLLCEGAISEGITLTDEDYAYMNDQLTGIRTQIVVRHQTDYNTYLSNMYAGYVNEEDMKKIMLMETLAAKYSARVDAMIEERMTDARIQEHLDTMSFPEGKDETVTRDLGHILASYMNLDEDQAYENVKTAKTNFEKGGKTDAAFHEQWENISDDANEFYKNLRPGEMVAQIDAWLFAEGRQIGDVGIISSDNGYHLLWYRGEGDPAYVADAKIELTEIISGEVLEEMRERFKIKVKQNVTEAIDV